MRNRKVGLMLASAAVMISSASCSSDDGDVPADQALVPVSTPSGWQESTFEGVTVATPGGWEESSTHDAEYDATMYNLQTAPNDHGTRGGVQVMTVNAPQRDAREAVEAHETQTGAVVSVTSTDKEEIEWPGAESAWFLTLEAEVPNDAGETAPHRAEYLILDLADGTQVQVTVTSLTEEFDELGMGDVLGSVTLG